VPLTSRDLIREEVEKLVAKTKEGLKTVQRIALAEAWKLLQLATASVIQVIEAIGSDLSSPEKKLLAMELLGSFYDKIFVVIDIPLVPNVLEPLIHKYVKAVLMILVSSTIDALVTTFREIGVFIKKESSPTQS
jgi:hypothetical protein